MSAGTSVVSAAKTAVASADKSAKTSPGHCGHRGGGFAAATVDNEEGVSWQTAGLVFADATDVLAADTTDALPAGTTHVLPTDELGVGDFNFERCFSECFHLGCQGMDFRRV